MFVEQVVLKYEGMEVYARRLEMVMLYLLCHIALSYYLGHLLFQHLMTDPDFLKASTINKVRIHLNMMDSELEKKLK